jgi:hypothetical protein
VKLGENETNLRFCSREGREESAKESSAHNKTKKVSITSQLQSFFFFFFCGLVERSKKTQAKKKERRSGDDLLTKPNAQHKKKL